jgi:hypothetical protein
VPAVVAHRLAQKTGADSELGLCWRIISHGGVDYS